MPMETVMIHVDETLDGQRALSSAASVIRSGGLVAFPTETVYGLGGDAKNPESSHKIYEAKGRPSDNPLIVHIAEYSQVEQIASEVPEEVKALSDAFWPGPLTIILNKNETIPKETTGGLDTVAIRMPKDNIARELILKSGCMIAAPSANVSGRPSPTTANHVYNDLNGKIDAIIDGGQAIIGLESTIVDLTGDVATILRPGAITKEMLEGVLGKVIIDPGLSVDNPEVKPKAPGMRYKHYAPKAELVVVEGNKKNVIEYINNESKNQKDLGKIVGAIVTSENVNEIKSDIVKTIGDSNNEEEIAHNLYGILREFDDTDVDLIYSEGFDESGIGQAIMNRLLRAAGHKVVNANNRAISRIIFAGKNGSARSPMAAAILRTMDFDKDIEILSRGILVQFPEPLNPKIEAVLKSNEIEIGDFRAIQLTDDDINDNTIIFTMEENHRKKIIEKLENANEENTYVISNFVGDELEIMNPYGGSLQLYGLCYEVLKDTLKKLVSILSKK